MKSCHKQNGYALLIVLIAIAILLILYATQMKALFLPDVGPEHIGVEQRPWMLEELLVAEDEDIKLPRSPKPTLGEGFELTAQVQRDGEARGTAMIAFATDGRVRATWQTEYTANERVHAITAAMEGNVVVKRTFEGPDGKDKSRLFFIARGDYLRKTTGDTRPRPDEEGTAWLLGWLKPDRTATGTLTLTTNRKWSAVYEWTAGIESALEQ